MSEWSDIGEKLKEAREERELILQDVANEIRIPLGTLRALEKNDYRHFPSPAYTRSFLQQYAEFLEVDAQTHLENLQSDEVLDQPADHNFVSHPPASTPHHPARRTPAANPAQPLIILIATAAFIALGVWLFFTIEGKSSQKEDTPPSTESR